MANPIPSGIKAFANCDHVIIAWKYDQPIPNCVGFALYKKMKGQNPASAQPLNNRIGFAGQQAKPGEQRPSTAWPIQRLLWTDFNVNPGDSMSYLVVPLYIKNNTLVKDMANATTWSNEVTVGTGSDIEAYFNRGIISSQFMSRQLSGADVKAKGQTLKSTLANEDSPVTQFLGGVLAKKLFAELDAVIADSSLSIYASLYELNDADVIDRFKKIGARLNLVLANGAFKSNAAGENDENADLRKELRNSSSIKLYDRIVSTGHFAHNKFMVFCKNGQPYKVWTGSTNLTQNGLYTQVNNAILVNDPQVANWYFNEWNQIRQAGNLYPPSFIQYNTKGNAKKNYAAWFAPVANQVDLDAAKALIDNVQQGILFLFSTPAHMIRFTMKWWHRLTNPARKTFLCMAS